MKLIEVLFKADAKLGHQGFTSAKLTAAAGYVMSFEAGLVSIAREDRPDAPPFLCPVANFIYVQSDGGTKRKAAG
jgi:hypothetical protein